MAANGGFCMHDGCPIVKSYNQLMELLIQLNCMIVVRIMLMKASLECSEHEDAGKMHTFVDVLSAWSAIGHD